MLGDMPFMAQETRNSRTGNRLRMTSDEALEVMFGLRAELEVRGGVWQRETQGGQKPHTWRPCMQSLRALGPFPIFSPPLPLPPPYYPAVTEPPCP